ncbi:hypothetical protein L2E82_33339 [Cichorium intybus]|uniref:Uncharacterized protein n=1 Tax=Cichorium intybus TaxID=13427 RepID=A0ACB9BJW0_CICIN|nr:hypothetical protein L2E82_33339 [Cichorium intybus]
MDNFAPDTFHGISSFVATAGLCATRIFSQYNASIIPPMNVYQTTSDLDSVSIDDLIHGFPSPWSSDD